MDPAGPGFLRHGEGVGAVEWWLNGLAGIGVGRRFDTIIRVQDRWVRKAEA